METQQWTTQFRLVNLIKESQLFLWPIATFLEKHISIIFDHCSIRFVGRFIHSKFFPIFGLLEKWSKIINTSNSNRHRWSPNQKISRCFCLRYENIDQSLLDLIKECCMRWKIRTSLSLNLNQRCFVIYSNQLYCIWFSFTFGRCPICLFQCWWACKKSICIFRSWRIC